VLALPCVVKGRVVAVAWAPTFDDCRAFAEEQIGLACGLVNAAAIAIENARLHQQMEQMAVIKERGRLSREMHDNLSQALGILKLTSSLSSGLLAEGQIEQVQTNLRQMRDVAAEAYTDAREAIFGLRTTALRGADFLPELHKYLTKYRTSYGLDARLEADNESVSVLTSQVTLQAFRIIQEALVNVRKHANADQVWVRIEPDDGRVRIAIEDDGQGFDPAQPATDARHGLGLQAMRERAESVGGWLEIDAQSGRGTRIVAWLPLSEE